MNTQPINLVKVGGKDYVNPYAISRITGDQNNKTSKIELINKDIVSVSQKADDVANTVVLATHSNSNDNSGHIFSVLA